MELNRNMIQELINSLKPASDDTYWILSSLEYVIEGKWHRRIWVDRWPEYSVIVQASTNSGEVSEINFIRIHTTSTDLNNMDSVKELLDQTEVFQPKNGLVINGITDHCKTPLLNYFAKRECYNKCTEMNLLVMEATDTTYGSLNKLRPLPGGCVETSLNENDLEAVAASWDYTDTVPGGKSYILNHIRFFPTVCIRKSDGTPISWFLGQEYGGMGLLYVLPEHRGQGLAKYMIFKLSDKLRSLGKKAVVCVHPENNVSIQLHKSCGFEISNKAFSIQIYSSR